jgi:putative ABC transport system permease protein
LIYRLVFENLKHRPVRTVLSAIIIGIQVTMILTLVGLSHGMLEDLANRSRGSGGDIFIRPPDSSLLGNSGTMAEGIVRVVRETPHVALATGTLVQPVSGLEYITGVRLEEFNAISGGFQYLEGGPFQQPDDVLIDDVKAREKHLHAGDTLDIGRKWHISGIVASGKLSRIFADIGTLQTLYSQSGHISTIYLKADDPSRIEDISKTLESKLETYKVYKMEDLVSLYSIDNTPFLPQFTGIVIGIGVVVGSLMVFLAMYTAVLERTREIGILKALGASPGYIVGILLRETTLLAITGAIAGILMSFATKGLMHRLTPSMPVMIVFAWWPWAVLIALAGSLIGAIYPGLKAAHQDAIEALAYD